MHFGIPCERIITYLPTYLKILSETKYGWVLLRSKFALCACISNATITNKTEGWTSKLYLMGAAIHC